MAGFGRDDARPDNGAGFRRMYSFAFQPLLSSLLSTVANMDFAYEREREKLSAATTDVNLRALERLKARHDEQREPYIRQMAILHDRIQQGAH
jgi:hypothetical protein